MRIVFDLDGTLSDDRHRRHHVEKHPKDFDSYHGLCGEDPTHPHIVSTLLALIFNENQVEVWTGRRDNYRAVTREWLTRALGPIHTSVRLRMVPESETRDTNTVKGEWADEWKPDMVFDDRQKCVDYWRARGIPCLQVAATS